MTELIFYPNESQRAQEARAKFRPDGTVWDLMAEVCSDGHDFDTMPAAGYAGPTPAILCNDGVYLLEG